MVELPSAPWRKNKVGRIASATDALFPDMSAVIAPENIVLVDEFACFLIECHERWDGGTLCSYPVQESGYSLFPAQPDVNTFELRERH